MEALARDLRQGARALLARPSFAIAAVAVLALGIGANVAIFSVLYSIVLRPLAYRDSGRLVMVWHEYVERDFGLVNLPWLNFDDLRDASRSFESLGAFSFQEFTVSRDETVERIPGARVTAGLLADLGVTPLRGRHFAAGEEEAASARPVIISHGLWQTRFGASDDLPGGTVDLDGRSFTVVGIMPPGFQFPPAFTSTLDGVTRAVGGAELWVPLEAGQFPANREQRIFLALGRLRPGVSLGAAQSEADEIGRRLAGSYPGENADLGFRIVPLREQVVGNVRPALLLLFAAVSLVTLLACANVANLFLTRAAGRRQEMAIRTALGAARVHLVRQLLAEAVWVALLGGACGLGLARVGVALLGAFGPADVPRLDEVGLHGPVLAFALGVSLATGLLFGIAPAWQASDPRLYRRLGGAGVARGAATRRVLVVAQIASSMVLLAAGGVLMRSFVRLLAVEPGFDAERVLAAHVFVPPSVAGPEGARAALHVRLMEEIAALPGVAAVGTVSIPPLSARGESAADVEIEGSPFAGSGERPQASVRPVGADYFRALRIPVVAGRGLSAADDASAAPLAVINETMAGRFWPGEDPVGRRILVGDAEDWITVVGVVGDVRHFGLDLPPRPEVYRPYAQEPGRSFTILLRAEGDPGSLAPALRRAAALVHPDLPVSRIEALGGSVSRAVAWPRLNASLSALFAALSLALAGVGVFGMAAHLAAQRAREIGVRLALGARPSQIVALVLERELATVGWAIALGLAGALAIGRLLESQVFGVSPHDPVTLIGAAALLALVALIAGLVPALRATRADPAATLRSS